MLSENEFLIRLRSFGVGHRKYTDEMFANDKPARRYGLYDEDDEELCHEVIKSTCHIPGCKVQCDTLLDYENHYNSTHKYTCSQCKKKLPTPHFLDLHVQETHDSFFAVMAERKPSYCCLIEECKEKFINSEERHDHCVQVHKLPKNFRYDQQRKQKPKKSNKKPNPPTESMETDVPEAQNEQISKPKPFKFQNSKSRSFQTYSGKKFTNDKTDKNERDVNIDEAMEDIRESLPE